MKLFKRRLKRIKKEAKDHWVFKVDLMLDDFEKFRKEFKDFVEEYRKDQLERVKKLKNRGRF